MAGPGEGIPLRKGILLAQPAASRLFDVPVYSVMQWATAPITLNLALCHPGDLAPTCAAPLTIFQMSGDCRMLNGTFVTLRSGP